MSDGRRPTSSGSPPPPASPTSATVTGAAGSAVTNTADVVTRIDPAMGRRRAFRDRAFRWACVATASVSVMVLIWLIASILREGMPWLTTTLLTRPPGSDPRRAGLFPAIFGTIWVCTLCGLFTLPVGIGTAILLEEFRPRSRVASALFDLIQLNISNLAGVPSVVYGILGLTAFVSMFGLFDNEDRPGQPWVEIGATTYDQFLTDGARVALVPVDDPSRGVVEPVDGMTAFMFPRDAAGRSELDYDNLVPVELNVISVDDEYPSDQAVIERTLFDDAEGGRMSVKSWYYLRLPFGAGVVAGALTLMLVILPVIIIATQESLRAVPQSLRDGARGLGATPLQVVWNVTLPAATPGIMTGSILAISRAIGETAPILMIAGIVYIIKPPQHLMDEFTVMPLQIYDWIGRPQEDFHHIAAAGIIVLLMILLSFNAVAVFIRQKMSKPLS